MVAAAVVLIMVFGASWKRKALKCLLGRNENEGQENRPLESTAVAYLVVSMGAIKLLARAIRFMIVPKQLKLPLVLNRSKNQILHSLKSICAAHVAYFISLYPCSHSQVQSLRQPHHISVFNS